MNDRGIFIISLDFELYWGVRDKRSLAACRDRISGGRAAIPRILSLFEQYGIHATWAVVGLSCFPDRRALLAGLPDLRPAYKNQNLSPYDHIADVGEDEAADPWHYGASIIQQIRTTPGQEIGTHTFSHYYCLEEGQSRAMFSADLNAARQAARLDGVEPVSLVFPRNQYHAGYLSLCPDAGIRAYRGNEESLMYEANDNRTFKSIPKRIQRLIDAYMNISGDHVWFPDRLAAGPPFNVPASRFLRPWSPTLRFLEPLKLARVWNSLEASARQAGLYHLWWHPEDFGRHTERNLASLERILIHFNRMEQRFGMRSMTMGEAADYLQQHRQHAG